MGYLVIEEDGEINVSPLIRNKAGIRNLVEQAIA
ncbi:hypothetical protein N007_17790 [Alicyclobacillus acidoterrestris ATCC 49025]|nr:hypothetical protein N007_17790 [Alicyclobacillus acidoterrestris ATCC 49025]